MHQVTEVLATADMRTPPMREHSSSVPGRGRRRDSGGYDAPIGETTHPVVDPVGIAMRDSVAYLQAWSLTGAGWRYYRLDRIQAVLPTGEPVADHGPAPNPQADWFDEFTGAVDRKSVV